MSSANQKHTQSRKIAKQAQRKIPIITLIRAQLVAKKVIDFSEIFLHNSLDANPTLNRFLSLCFVACQLGEWHEASSGEFQDMSTTNSTTDKPKLLDRVRAAIRAKRVWKLPYGEVLRLGLTERIIHEQHQDEE